MLTFQFLVSLKDMNDIDEYFKGLGGLYRNPDLGELMSICRSFIASDESSGDRDVVNRKADRS
jgi:hypothetical protein